MKKLITMAAVLVALPALSLAANVKLINDSKHAMSIHTGSGIVKMNKGGSTSFTCKTGRKVYIAKNGKKAGELFTVKSEHCGKTIKLSSVT